MGQASKIALGRHHPIVRRVRALYRDATLRLGESVFLAEGLHLAEEAVAARASVELALVAPRLTEREDGRRVQALLEGAGVPCAWTTDPTLDALQDARSPQPVLLVVRRPVWPAEAGLTTEAPPPLVVVLHGVQDPGNVGAILRTADAAGATALFVCGECADPFHPRAVRASMGAIFRVPVRPVDGPGQATLLAMPALLAMLSQRGIATLGADADALLDYSSAELHRPVALFFGGEGAGLPPALRDQLGGFVRVPMRPGVNSLSVGAAAAVLLFEAARRRASVV